MVIENKVGNDKKKHTVIILNEITLACLCGGHVKNVTEYLSYNKKDKSLRKFAYTV